MHLSYDSEADAIYVRLRPGGPAAVKRTVDLGGHRHADYDAAGNVLGVEFLVVSRGIDLTDVPEAGRVAEALRAIPHPASA